MDKKLLLKEACNFLGLSESFSLEELKESYHKLAKKYHPDSSEFESDVMFLELNKHYEFLKLEIESGNSKNSFDNKPKLENNLKQETKSKDIIFQKYKDAKEMETKAILKYYERRKLSPIELSSELNKELLTLRRELEPVLLVYKEIIDFNPDSIWCPDARDSIERLKVWWDTKKGS
ncbi:J domain-containing protein [Leptospira sp. 96542]|nr:J domain-containing protein [Leptospira sp. 96542]